MLTKDKDNPENEPAIVDASSATFQLRLSETFIPNQLNYWKQ